MKIIFTLFTLFFFTGFGYCQCITDTIPPVVTCNINITTQLSNAGITTILPIEIGTASDNCTINTQLVNGQASYSFTCADLGVNTVLYSATDASGNTSSCSAIVTVLDTIAPIINCNNNVDMQLSNAGIATLIPSQVNNNSSDNCGINSMLINGQTTLTFDCNDLGSNAVVLYLLDASGNSSSCTSNVSIMDSLSFCTLSNPAVQPEEERILIYPNPTAQQLNITSKESLLQQITLTSITGQVILTQKEALSQNTAQLDVSALPNAVYLITVITSKGITTQKVVVQH